MAGKKYKEALKKIDREKRYTLEEAVKLVVDNKVAKFDETVEIAVRLGVVSAWRQSSNTASASSARHSRIAMSVSIFPSAST